MTGPHSPSPARRSSGLKDGQGGATFVTAPVTNRGEVLRWWLQARKDQTWRDNYKRVVPSANLQAWMDYKRWERGNVRFQISQLLTDPAALDALIEWKLNDIGKLKQFPQVVETLRKKGVHLMQRQWTIELRVDYADEGKNQAMQEACARAAKHIYAMACLLTDQVKPAISVYGEDFFTPRHEIEMFEDVIAKGISLTADQPDTEVSSELLAAVREVEFEQPKKPGEEA